jgi:hypothetical protein
LISTDEIMMLAFYSEYSCNDEIQGKIDSILEKIENNISIDTYVGNRLLEYGKSMGWHEEDPK